MPYFIRKNFFYKDIRSWAKTKLSPDDLESFYAAFEEAKIICKKLYDDGFLRQETLYQNVHSKFLNEEICVYVGDKIEINTPQPNEIPVISEWEVWVKRFIDDEGWDMSLHFCK